MWVNPKIDWAEDDYHNFEDMNRIESNTVAVADYLASIHYNMPAITAVTNRNTLSIDFISSINRIENNIEAIKNAFATPSGYLPKKTWLVGMGFNWQDANRLEQNLKLLYEWGLIAKENQIYCGTFSCGTEWEGGLY